MNPMMALKNLGLFLLVFFSFSLDATAQQIRPHVPLPDEPVRSAIFSSCSACHGIDVYAYHALDRTGWQAMLTDTHQLTSSFSISVKHEEILLDFLVENFGAQTIPFPREYVPAEINGLFSDIDARVFLEQTCAECHEIRVFNRRGTETEWRGLVFEMRENGAQLSNENLERLVEWLARTRGPIESLPD